MSKPLLTIDNFAGMSDDGGIFYNEGFLPTKINGKSVMEDTFYGYSFIDTTTTGFSNLDTVSSGTSYIFTDSNYGAIFISVGGLIFVKNISSAYDGVVHTIAPSGNNIATQYGDVLQTKDGNILYSSANALGIGYSGVVKAGSNTTQIIDTAGRNFATLGADITNVNRRKITNLRTGIEYTITGIADGDATNDKVTFTASGTNDNQEGDIFIVWIDDKVWTTAATFFTTTAYPQYTGQVAKTDFRRQIEQYGDLYYCLNGNFLAQVSSDETTLDDNYKQLPYRHQAVAFDVNGGNLLVASSKDSKGYLLFWDGFSDGWNNIMELDEECFAVHAYKDGWVVFFNNTFYYTNGWQIQPISSPYPDDRILKSGWSLRPYGFCSIYIQSDRFYITNTSYVYSRMVAGTCVYDQKYGWAVFPTEQGDRNRYSSYYYPTAIFEDTKQGIVYIGGEKIVNTLETSGSTNDVYRNKALMFYLNFGQNTNISQLELDISNNLRKYLVGSDTSLTRTKIQVSIGDVSEGVFGRAQVGASSTTSSLIVNGTIFVGADVGDEIQIQWGNSSGERSFITAITGTGTATETWAISPVLSTTPTQSAEIKVIKVKHCETKIIDGDKLNEPIKFDCKGIIASKAMIEIVVHGYSATGYSSFPISINSIKLYG